MGSRDPSRRAGDAMDRLYTRTNKECCRVLYMLHMCNTKPMSFIGRDRDIRRNPMTPIGDNIMYDLHVYLKCTRPRGLTTSCNGHFTLKGAHNQLMSTLQVTSEPYPRFLRIKPRPETPSAATLCFFDNYAT